MAGSPSHSWNGCELKLNAEGLRGLYATRAFKAGEVVLSCRPLVHPFLHLWLAESHCSSCFASKAPHQKSLLRCSRCRTVSYCGAPCQREDWVAGHKHECKALPTLTSKYNAFTVSDMVLLGRVLRALPGPKDSWSEISAALLPELSDVDTAAVPQVELEAQRALAVEFLTSPLMGSLSLPEADDVAVPTLVGAFFKFQCNNFAVTTDTLKGLGASVNVEGAYLNHSCWPTTGVLYEAGTHAQVFRALRDIESGTELTHSYTDAMATTAARQQTLQSMYYFRCNCERCRGACVEVWSGANRPASTAALPTVTLDFAVINRQLSEVLVEDDPEGTARVHALEALGEEVTAAEGDTEKEWTLLNKVLAEASQVLGPFHLSLVRTRSALLDLALLRDDLLFAVALSASLAAHYEAVYGCAHALTGLQLETTGELAAELATSSVTKLPPLPPVFAAKYRSWKEVVRDYLGKASRVLSITHGKGHAFVAACGELSEIFQGTRGPPA